MQGTSMIHIAVFLQHSNHMFANNKTTYHLTKQAMKSHKNGTSRAKIWKGKLGVWKGKNTPLYVEYDTSYKRVVYQPLLEFKTLQRSYSQALIWLTFFFLRSLSSNCLTATFTSFSSPASIYLKRIRKV